MDGATKRPYRDLREARSLCRVPQGLVRHAGQKFLLLSGTVNASVFDNSPEKPDHFMPKPYALDEFSAVVRNITGSPSA